jgi:outer membrane protein assembly factor BamB
MQTKRYQGALLLLVIFSASLLLSGFSNLKTATGNNSSVNLNDDPNSWPMFLKDLTHSSYSTTWGPQTNDVLWSALVGEIESSPAVVNGIVYVGTNQGFVYAWNAFSGAIIWTYMTNENIESSPTVVDNVVYIGAGNYSATRDSGHIYALQAATGEVLWSYQTGGPVDSSPTVTDGRVYVGCQDGNFYVLDASTGNKLWSVKTGIIQHSSAAVVVNIIYICSSDFLYALNAENGMQLWNYTADWGYLASSPMIANNIVYLSSDGVYAFDALTGNLVWHQPGDRYPNSMSTPALADGVIYVGTGDGYVWALNATIGTKRWEFNTESTVAASPAIANGIIYVSSCNGTLYSLDASNGTELWKYDTSCPSGVFSSPAIANGICYVGLADGFYAFGNLSQTPPTQPTSAWTLLVETQNGSTVNLIVNGNITSTQMSNIKIAVDKPSMSANITFKLEGEKGNMGFSNITIPKTEIPEETSPSVYIDNMLANNQGFTQNGNNYYVWFTTHFSIHQISILFTSKTQNNQTSQIDWTQIVLGAPIAAAIIAVILVSLILTRRNRNEKL